MSFLKFLGLGQDEPEPVQAETESVRRIVQELERLEPGEARLLAAFAYVLGRVARADLEISDAETRAMVRIVRDHGRLLETQAELVVQIVRNQVESRGSTEDFKVTREFDRIATRKQKLALLECLFAVAAADESVSTTEEAMIRQIADELKLQHEDYIQARLTVREHLDVLKPGR